MGQSSGFFDAEELVDGGYDREYLAEQWANYFNLFIGNGVFATPTNQLKVIAYTGMHVKVSVGWAFINGYWYHNDTELDLEIPANVTASTRTDGIFVQWDSSERRIIAVVGQGRTAVNRIAPYYELKLAEVVVATGATAITDAVITDTRADSSVCGFVTGVIDVIDSTNLFAQFTSIFNEWFEAMREQAIADKEDWDEWYAALQEELHNLPPDSAEYLQIQIDELKESGLSGSIINISTINSSLQGKTVTMTSADGQEVRTGTFDSNLKCTINGFKSVGTATITATDGLQTATSSLSIQYFSNYAVALAFWSATVNIHTTNASLYNKTITITKGGTTVGTTSFNSSGEATFTATEAGTYTFTCEEVSVSQAITAETTYDVYLGGGSINLQDWLTAGGVTGTYNTFADVEADEEAVRKLMTIHNAVDYLAQSDGTDELISDVINSDICAKWINLRDYALDTLSANTNIKTLMDTADKYGYGEWVLEGQVPTMTSNTAPYGEVLNNNQYHTSQYAAFRAFDDGSQGWLARQTQPFFATGDYVGYDFKQAIKITEAKVTSLFENATGSFTIKIQASVNGTDWTDISDVETITNSSSNTPTYFKDLQNVDGARYYRVYVVTNSTSNGYGLKVQFYAYQPKGNVPIMTSNTTPYGEAISSGAYSDTSNYYVFDDNLTTEFIPSVVPSNNAYIGYKFVNPVCVKQLKAYWYSGQGVDFTIKVQASNDGTNWEDLTDSMEISVSSTASFWSNIEFENSDYYLCYRVLCVSISVGRMNVHSLQFYGREMKVSVPTMTSNTAPWGEASTQPAVTTSGYEAFRAFDGVSNTRADFPKGSDGCSIQYRFESPVAVKMVGCVPYSGANAIPFSIQGSNDGIDWVTLGNFDYTGRTLDNATLLLFEINNSNAYLYYRYKTNPSNSSWTIWTLQFYGFDYSEYDWDTENPRHYLYDHGVELEEITLQEGGASATKTIDSIIITSGSDSPAYSRAYTSINFTSYNMLRVVTGLRAKNVAASTGGQVEVRNGTNTDALASRDVTTSDLPRNAYLDVSNVNTAGLAAFSIDSRSSGEWEVTEWWLE